jgi:hypothetical protein
MEGETMMGSLINRMMETSTMPKPEIGMGATVTMFSDRYPATVVAVSESGKTLTIQFDKYARVDGNGMSDCQQYTYEADPNGVTAQFRLTKNGWKRLNCSDRLLLNYRERYFDFSF